MEEFPLDPETADRLLSGQIAPDDAPPGYAELASLIRAAHRRRLDAEQPGEDEAVARMAEVVAGARRSSGAGRVRRSARQVLRANVAAFATATVLVSTTSLAAAGALPRGAQVVMSRVLNTVGLDIPNPAKPEAVTLSADEDDSGVEGGPSGRSGTPTPREGDVSPAAASSSTTSSSSTSSTTTTTTASTTTTTQPPSDGSSTTTTTTEPDPLAEAQETACPSDQDSTGEDGTETDAGADGTSEDSGASTTTTTTTTTTSGGSRSTVSGGGGDDDSQHTHAVFRRFLSALAVTGLGAVSPPP